MRNDLKTLMLLLSDITKDYSIIEKFLKNSSEIKTELPKPGILKRGFSHHIKRERVDYYSVILNEILRIREEFKDWLGIEGRGEVKYLSLIHI